MPDYRRASEDDAWMASMRERFDRNLPYARPGPYMTTLDPADEQQFRAWVTANKVPFNPNDPVADYDMRGFWLAAQMGDPSASTAVDPNDGRLHFTDKFKTPYHETFSNESQYAQPTAPRWTGDQLIDAHGKVIFDDKAVNAR